ncbi:hypothetical protein HXX01_04900 [Candidatus Nomurabacteria bacterium]|nr:hypothetical protein [Candidatus Nomurabacteria bacterium]
MKNAMTSAKTIEPIQCHLWQKSPLSKAELDPGGTFEILQEFRDDSHEMRRLLKFRECGQLYFYKFHEDIAWGEGDDQAYRTYIPIGYLDEASELAARSAWDILKYYPKLQWDSPAIRNKPEIYWIGK